VPDDDVLLGGLTVAFDVSPGVWVVAGLRGRHEVRSLIPDGYGAYARVFHPAYRLIPAEASPSPDVRWRMRVREREVRWREVANANGRVVHPAMEWTSITGAYRYSWRDSQPGIWDTQPERGSLTWKHAATLASLLATHTQTPDRCWFGIWEGWGDLPYLGSLRPPRLGLPGRDMILLSGPLSEMPLVSFHYHAANVPGDELSNAYRSPSLWWPEDRAWCVATDVDLMSTYIGASANCVADLVADEQLEALEVTPQQTLTFDTDAINPVPEGSRDEL
jgi:hypothetical protein